MKVYLRPHGTEIDAGTGIGQVVIAQLKYLKDFDIQVTGDYKKADVIAVHTQSFDLPRTDVLMCHGLYWSGDELSGSYLGWHSEANKRIVAAARRAKIITVPSEWVAGPFRRDMRINPEIVGHGIDFIEWQATENGGYVLWNKNRPNDVCNPEPAYQLAARGIPLHATFMPEGKPTLQNMTVTGRLPFETMKREVQSADIYLATVKETFGIGTIEAMACGVPVLGWDWGGTADIVQHKVTGWLSQPGDLDGLVEGYHWIREHRAELSEAAREKAKEYSWEKVIARYAEIYHKVARPDPVGVAVVIPCYNYGAFVNEAIYSCLNQTRKPDEIIVVDDGSTDQSKEVIQSFEQAGVKAIYQQNKGVAAARNAGIASTKQPFIICLDADDRLAPRFIEVALKGITSDRGMGIAYTGIGLIHGEGDAQRYTAWPPEFDWNIQSVPHVPPSNCIPSANMFRRAMWERAGGFRQQYAPGEDTEFWTRGLSVGFTAKKVSDESLFEYRTHQGSASRTKTYTAIDLWMPWMHDRQFPMAAPSDVPPIVRSYSEPIVSIVIPCSPEHVKIIPSAIESVIGQDFREWEMIVVFDGIDDKEFRDVERHYPFIRAYRTWGTAGAGFARNVGLEEAKAPLIMWLDADDYILPGMLSAMVKTWGKSGGRFIYTDWQTADGEKHIAPEYDHLLYKKTLFHGVTALMTTEQAKAVKGFDPTLEAWEDWDFYVKMAIHGFHGKRLEGAYLVYRLDTGIRRKIANAKADELKKTILRRYEKYLLGDAAMSPCCGGSKAAEQILRAKRLMGGQAAAMESVPMTNDTVRVEYFGVRTGGVTFVGKSGKRYIFGNNTINRYNDVDPQDVELFLSMEGFRALRRPEPVKQQEAKAAPPKVIEAQAQIETHQEPEPAQETVKDVPVVDASQKTPVKRTRKPKA